MRATKTANPGTVRQLACRNGIEISDFDAVGGVGISEARRRCRAIRISDQSDNLFPSTDYASHGFSLAVAELGCKDN